jgi:hypothetical protein
MPMVVDPSCVSFTSCQHQKNKNSFKDDDYYDGHHCCICGEYCYGQAQLPGDSSPWVCKNCWSKVHSFFTIPLSNLDDERKQSFTIEDVKKMVNAVTEFENDIKNKKMKFDAATAAYIAQNNNESSTNDHGQLQNQNSSSLNNLKTSLYSMMFTIIFIIIIFAILYFLSPYFFHLVMTIIFSVINLTILTIKAIISLL